MEIYIFLERLQYESRPLIYAVMSVFSFVTGTEMASVDEHSARLLIFGGFMLAISCYSVVKMRYEYRTRSR